MQYIVVAAAFSSGQMYIGDILARGYTPICVMPNDIKDVPYYVEYTKMCARNFDPSTVFMDEDDDFEVFVSKLRKYDIVACVPGSERGVRLSDRICSALGLRGNDPADTYLRCNKEGMDEALAKAGIRRIQTARVKTGDDVRRFWNDNGLRKAVIKFSESAGTVGLKICTDLEEAVAHLEDIESRPNGEGVVGADAIIQEFIGGTEYIVNTVSSDGRHALTDIWQYDKVISEDGSNNYDCCRLIKNLEPGHLDMIRYAYRVLDAVHMKWGACHIEIKIDDKGPCLIETNARPMGLAMTAAYLDECLGHHITDLSLRAILEPDRFDEIAIRPYIPRKYALFKLMIVPENIKGSFEPTFIFSQMIRSVREVLFFESMTPGEYHRTIDLDTSPITIKMISDDYGKLRKDYELLRLIESKYFHLYYTLGDRIPASAERFDISKIIPRLDPQRAFLICTEKERYVRHHMEDGPETGWRIYDGIVYAHNGETLMAERMRDMLMYMNQVRPGGLFIITPESYVSMPYGSISVEFLLNLAGFDLMAPTHHSDGLVIGMKR